MFSFWFLLTALSGLLPHAGVHVEGRAVGADTVRVAVRTFQYRAERLDVQAGTVVEWRNEDQIEHTVSADSNANKLLFHLPMAEQGARVAFTFERPGSYAYTCARHPFMRGEIHVTLKGDRQ